MKIRPFTRVSVLLFIVLLCHSVLLAEDIPLSKKGGVYELPVEINGVLTLNFVLDSGASDVLLPADVVLTLVRTGTIKDTDFLPGQTYVLADGSTVKSQKNSPDTSTICCSMQVYRLSASTTSGIPLPR